MSRRVIDLTGKQFGRLTVIKRVPNEPGKGSKWLCRCECGNTTEVGAKELKDSNERYRTKSCGCLRTEKNRMIAENNRTHNHSNTRLYRIWAGIKQRCKNPNNPQYILYGGKGISVCKEWDESFAAFEAWALSHGYNPELSIDRKENDKGYYPENCRWATSKEQGNNRSSNVLYTINGITKTRKGWAEHYNKNIGTVRSRLKRGWSIEEALDLTTKGE